MSESELLQALFSSTQAIIGLYGMFVTIVSAYIAGLYLFLRRAPFLLRLLAFSLLSVSLAFLGGAAAVQQATQDALFVAWLKLPNPSIPASVIVNPFPVQEMYGVSARTIGLTLGWAAAFSVYAALAFMTFLYRWKDEPGLRIL